MKRLLAMVLLASLVGCAAHYEPGRSADPYGFILGIWHGIIFPFSLLANVVSWLLGFLGISFLDSIQIIGRPNTGFWYYVGFVMGLGISIEVSIPTQR